MNNIVLLDLDLTLALSHLIWELLAHPNFYSLNPSGDWSESKYFSIESKSEIALFSKSWVHSALITTRKLYWISSLVYSLIKYLTTRLNIRKFHSIVDSKASGWLRFGLSLLYLAIIDCRQTIPTGILRYQIVVWPQINLMSLVNSLLYCMEECIQLQRVRRDWVMKEENPFLQINISIWKIFLKDICFQISF